MKIYKHGAGGLVRKNPMWEGKRPQKKKPFLHRIVQKLWKELLKKK